MREYTIRVHEIATDGLPPRHEDDLAGRTAFIFDGCIVSGWPLHNGPDYDGPVYLGTWEADEDVGRRVEFGGVTHWVEFPVPVHRMEKP